MTGFQVVCSDLTVEQARAAGACLARLHRVLEPLPDLGWWRYNVAYDPAAWLTRLDALRRAIEGLSDQDMTDAWALERLRVQCAWLADPACPHTADLSGPRQTIHGDHHDENPF